MLLSSGSSCFSGRLPRLLLVAAPALILMLSGCTRETAEEAPPPRPVRTVVVEKGGLASQLSLRDRFRRKRK